MDTRIYNGFVFFTEKSFNQALSTIHKSQKKLNDKADAIWAKNVVSDATLAFDIDNHLNKTSDKNYLADCNQSLEEELVLAFRRRIPTQLDLEAKIHMQTVSIGDKIFIVGLHFINNKELCDTFWSHNSKVIKPYQYYEGSDKPESISDKEWFMRKKVWSAVFKSNNEPDMSMFSINLTKAGPRSVQVSTIDTYIPDDEMRAQNLANHLLIEELLENKDKHEFKTDSEVHEYLQGEEHEKNLIERAGELYKQLKPVNCKVLMGD